MTLVKKGSNMIWFGIALAAITLWGLADFVGSEASSAIGRMAVILLNDVVAIILFSTQYVLNVEPPLGPDTFLYAALSGPFGLMGFWLFFFALSIGNAVVVAPFFTISDTFVTALGGGLAQGFSTSKLLGLSLAVIAIPMLLHEHPNAVDDKLTRSKTRVIVFYVSCASGAILGINHVFIGLASRNAVYGPLVIERVASLIIMVAVLAGLALRRRAMHATSQDLPDIFRDVFLRKKAMIFALSSGLLYAGGYIGYLVAQQQLTIPIMAIFIAFQPVPLIILSIVFKQQRLTGRQIVGVFVSCLAVGVAGYASL